MTTRTQRAHDSETAVSGWFRSHGWPFAEPVGAGRSGSDVTGMPGLVVEVKARRDFRPVEWLRQHAIAKMPVEAEPGSGAQSSPLPFVVWRPDGMGPASVGCWGVMMRLDDFTALLREAGYGG